MGKSIADTAIIFKALGDSTRLKILKLIIKKGNNLCVGMIAHTLNISQPAVSQHLKVLKSVGLLESNRYGFNVHYSIRKESLLEYDIDIIEFLNTFGEEINFEKNCEYKIDKGVCKKFK